MKSTHDRLLSGLSAAVVLMLVAAGQSQQPKPVQPFQVIASESLHHLFRIGDKVYAGSGPESIEDFRFLKGLGVRTILSVDGAVPAVETARELGLRYVHVPLKYSEIRPEDVQKLASLLNQVEGAVYIHCHHGKHRGPAATAIVCQQAGLLSKSDANDFLLAAGTGQQYAGLWKSVREYQPTPLPENLPVLPEQVAPEGLQESMVHIETYFSRLKRIGTEGTIEQLAAAWKSDGIALQEEFRESARFGTDDEELRNLLQESETLVGALERAATLESAVVILKKLEQRCGECHAQFRS